MKNVLLVSENKKPLKAAVVRPFVTTLCQVSYKHHIR